MKPLRLGRTTLVSSAQDHDWASCRTITRNLLKAYQRILGDGAVLHLQVDDRSYLSVWKAARQIADFRPERVVFVENPPHPQRLIEELFKLHPEKASMPQLFFHIYGDFTLYSTQWTQLNSILEGLKVCFICASHRQKKMVAQFLTLTTDSTVQMCPFPTDTKDFYFSEEVRASSRKELGLTAGDFTVVYTGRLSLQKNLIFLLNELYYFWEASKAPIKFLLAGTFDDLGAPFFGVNLERHSFYHYWKLRNEFLPKKFADRVRFVGNLDADSLNRLCNAADVYANLSLHHDEDFGMAPAEALCAGTQTVLTDWGGFFSFKKDGLGCHLVPVKLHQRGLLVSRASLQKYLTALWRQKDDAKSRTARSAGNREKFSIDGAAACLASIHQSKLDPFRGFNWLMKNYETSYRNRTSFIEGMKPGTFYERIYESYIAESGK